MPPVPGREMRILQWAVYVQLCVRVVAQLEARTLSECLARTLSEFPTRTISVVRLGNSRESYTNVAV